MTTITREMLAASWQSWLSNDNRERVGPLWLQWVWTLLFCAALALGFTVLGFFVTGRDADAWQHGGLWLKGYRFNFIICLTIGVAIHLLFDTARATFATPARVGAWRGWQRTVFFSGVPMLGVAIGWPTGVALAGGNLARWMAADGGVRSVIGMLLMALFLVFVLHHWFGAKARAFDADRRAAEAQLKLLQAQIEPHFLFNTLANVLSLIDHDTPKAKAMLAAFTGYLRSGFTLLRQPEGTLAQELELAANYLRLLAARMDDRLSWAIDADDAARRLTLPPLLLQPLVENAVQHGLEPTIEGGHVALRARVDAAAQALVVEVQDNGRGLDAAPAAAPRRGAGMALANIRERLRARYGSGATLAVMPAQPGTLARLTIPLAAMTAPQPA